VDPHPGESFDFGGVPVHHFIAAVSERHDEMAYGMVGVVTGYWLR